MWFIEGLLGAILNQATKSRGNRHQPHVTAFPSL
jgi:hypothetical protein